MGFLLGIVLTTIISLSAGQVVADIMVHDSLGNSIHLSNPAKRIVSLAPHTTENLFAAGGGESLVGVMQYSDYPPEAKLLPRIGSHAGLDFERIISLKPDLILAWDNGNRQEDIDRLRQLGFTIYMSKPRQLTDIATEIEALGILVGTRSTAQREARRFRRQLHRLQRQYANHKLVRVFYELWHQPLMTINGEQIISKAIAVCGGRNIFANLPVLAPSINIEAVLDANPEVIVIAADDNHQYRQRMGKWNRWKQLAAVYRNNLYPISPDLLQRQGPRILQGIEQLCEIIAKSRRNRIRQAVY